MGAPFYAPLEEGFCKTDPNNSAKGKYHITPSGFENL